MSTVVWEPFTAFLVEPAKWTPVEGSLMWNPADPYAVVMQLEQVRWLMGRELVRAGLHQPSGLCDVRLWPSRARSALWIHLRAPLGQALLELPYVSVERFLDRTESSIPIGAENLDDACDTWLTETLRKEGQP